MSREQAASNLQWQHWCGGTRLAELPADMRPATRADGYAVQALLEARSADPTFGWKIAATSPAGQAHIGVDGPLAGRILAERVIPDGGKCPFGVNHMRVAEVEFAFRMGETLPPRAASYEVEEVFAAVDTLHPSIEIPDSRYKVFERVGAPQLIADNACAHFFVLGPAAPNCWRELDLAACTPTGWVNEIPRGGTCMIPMAIAPGDRVRGDFGVLGAVSVTMETEQ